FKFNDAGDHLIWKQIKDDKTTSQDSFDLKPVLQNWLLQKAEYGTIYLTEEFTSFPLKGAHSDIRFVLKNASVEKSETGHTVSYLRGAAFIR
ncbi:MAG: hypothetical protein JNJ57_05035, partial [Saprospiraceae bacterium]|nr:hypothetical protein [Saprospiraceae bacterium]